jgi:hypothetical protein
MPTLDEMAAPPKALSLDEMATTPSTSPVIQTPTYSETPDEAFQRAKEAERLATEHNLSLDESQSLIAGDEPGAFGKALEKIRGFINDKTGLLGYDTRLIGEPYYPQDHPVETGLGVSARTAGTVVSGLTVTAADILVNKTVGDKTLADLITRVAGPGGYQPSEIDKEMNVFGEDLLSLMPVGAGTAKLVSKIPASRFLQTLFSSGLTFGSTSAAVQASRAVTEGTPVDWKEVHLQSAYGVGFGAGEFAVGAALTGFAKGFEKYWGIRDLSKTGPVPGKGSLQDQVAAQEIQKRNDIARAKAAHRRGEPMPQDLVDKYMAPPKATETPTSPQAAKDSAVGTKTPIEAQTRAIEAPVKSKEAPSIKGQGEGQMKRLYHGTTAEFEQYNAGAGIGPHFGTVEQANNFAEGMNSNVRPVDVAVKNPLRLDDGFWENPAGLALKLKKAGIIDDAGLNSFLEIKGESTQFEWLRKTIRDAGYDSIVYSNAMPGEGAGDSYIPLDPGKQVKSAFSPTPTVAEEKVVVSLDASNKTLLDHLKVARKLREDEVEPAIKALRARQAKRGESRLAAGLAAGRPAGEAIRKSTGGYKDMADVPEIEPPPLSDAQWELYSDKILEVYPPGTSNNQFHITDAQKALDRLRGGKILTNSEFAILEPVFGKDTTIAMHEAMQRYAPPSERKWQMVRDIVSAWKLPFNLDLQIARQGSSFVARNPIIYSKSVGVGAASYLDKGYAERTMAEVLANPNHADAVKSGINFLSDAPYSTNTPEQFTTDLPAKMVRLGKASGPITKTLTAPVRVYGEALLASERSFVASANYMMQALWDTQAQIWSHSNLSPAKLAEHKANYANTINTFMKLMKAKSPTGKAVMKVANLALFSPSMTFSRPYRIKALIMNTGSRRYAAELIATELAKIWMISGMGVLAASWSKAKNPEERPPVDSDMNPLSSNWGKIRVRNTYHDYGGGDIQFYRTVGRLITLHAKNQQGDIRPIDFADTIAQYATTRETALLSSMGQLISGYDYMGKPITPTQVAIDSAVPQFMQNIYDAMKEDGALAGFVAGAEGLASAGVNSYPESASSKFNRLADNTAKDKFGKTWDELLPGEQSALKALPELIEAQAAIKSEQIGMKPNNNFMKEQLLSSEKIRKSLPDKLSKAFKEHGVTVGISRTIEDGFYLNDELYERYLQQTGVEINAIASPIVEAPQWKSLPNSARAAILGSIAGAARESAKGKLLAEIYLGQKKK